MSSELMPRKAGDSWVIEIPDEMARAMGVPPGSVAVLRTAQGAIEVEVLSPPSPELDESVRRVHDKYKEAFEEMRRLGD
jgi:antitoxin component of MazEF toxin-antitoxin module